MSKLNFAFAALILVAGVPSAQADSSGHISINSLNAELPRSHDPLSPMSDGLRVPSPTHCLYARQRQDASTSRRSYGVCG
jgi:hypothetical protein